LLSYGLGFKLSGMSDREREGGGGLAVLVLTGFLVLLLLFAGGGTVWIFIRQAERSQ
jgi:hypothetical protein